MSAAPDDLNNVLYTPADMFHYSYAPKMEPQLIVLHATAGKDSWRWLTKESNPPVSAHYLIDKTGRIRQLVPLEALAWHAGASILFPDGHGGLINVNRIAFGIEMENLNDGKDTYPLAQVEAVSWLCVGLWHKYGYLPVLSHRDIDNRKSDPRGFPWAQFLGLLGKYLAQGTDLVSSGKGVRG
jgi:N-acetyl-anhydromuramyl-L-alanine amidase AmpD